VLLFQRKLHNFLFVKFNHLTKIYYFSDAASSQNKKRKNSICLCCHKDCFGMDAERQLFALSYGRDAYSYEGTRQTITRLARKVSQKNTGSRL
jgi:hypothetical protein